MNGRIVILRGSRFTRQRAQLVISLAALRWWCWFEFNQPTGETAELLGDVKLIIIFLIKHRFRSRLQLEAVHKADDMRGEKMENDCMTSGLDEHLHVGLTSSGRPQTLRIGVHRA